MLKNTKSKMKKANRFLFARKDLLIILSISTIFIVVIIMKRFQEYQIRYLCGIYIGNNIAMYF